MVLVKNNFGHSQGITRRWKGSGYKYSILSLLKNLQALSMERSLLFYFIDTVFILPIACKLPRGCLFSMPDSCDECYGVLLASPSPNAPSPVGTWVHNNETIGGTSAENSDWQA